MKDIYTIPVLKEVYDRLKSKSRIRVSGGSTADSTIKGSMASGVRRSPSKPDKYNTPKGFQPMVSERVAWTPEEQKAGLEKKRREGAEAYAARIEKMSDLKEVTDFINLFDGDKSTLMNESDQMASREEMEKAITAWQKKFIKQRELMVDEESALKNIPALHKKYLEFGDQIELADLRKQA
ncbi:hypothetical protein ISS03_05045 [Patescibacteria group bacterium]|nr:hypothetical protein [Patescibacteria group bacterium]